MFDRVVNMLEIMNITGFWIWLWFKIWQGSVYNMVLNIPGFWIYQGFENARVLNIPGLQRHLNVPKCQWIIPDNAWLCLNIPGCWPLIRAYAWDFEYIKVLNMALVLYISGFWICQFSECTRVLNVPEYPWIIPKYAWLCLNLCEYAWIYQNMLEYA